MRGDRRWWRMAALALGLSGVVLAGDAILAWRALRGAAAESSRLHQVVAERLFDELERELTALVSQEEGRSFLEYRYFYVPERQLQGSASLLRSPLSELPDDALVVGYFQIDPDGSLFTPARPRGNEFELARDNEGFTPDDRLAALEAELRDLTAQADWRDSSALPADRLAQLEPDDAQSQGVYAATVQSLNRSGRDRQGKKVQAIKAPNSNVANFTNDDLSLDTVWSMPPQLAEQQRQSAAEPVPVSSPPLPGGLVDVLISPIRGTSVGERLLLHRTVRVGADTYRQGVVLRQAALQAHIAQRVLADSEVAPYVQLRWAAVGDAQGSVPYAWEGYTFTHRFAEPFSDMQVTAQLTEIPGAGDGGQRVILGMSAILALVTVAGAAALYRSVSAELEFAERRNNFVAAVSHELKTPLTAIRMYSEMLREGMVPTEEKQHQYYETITAEAERLSRLINNVLELSRLERGTRSMHLSAGAVGPILEQTADILRPHVERQGMRLVVRVAPGLPPVQVEADALSQILVNLIDNAVKFSRESQDSTGEIVLWAGLDAGGMVQVGVRDHGPGVPARQLRRIFEPFYRGERELTRRTQGTGIGLALVARLAGQMRGRVVARNHPEGGLEVCVSLVPVLA